jgi:hypothetical protein
MERAAVLAVDLAADLAERMPHCCAVPAAGLMPVVWPLAVRLERLERQASKGRKQAKAYRKAVRRARRDVEQLLATQDGSAARLPALLRTVPMDPAAWRVALTPGAPVGVAAETEAA